MSKLFIGFLGLGRVIKEDKDYLVPGYDKLSYLIDGKKYPETIFAQRTILEHQNVKSFDKVILFMTAESEKRHLNLLLEELKPLGFDVQCLKIYPITDSMSVTDQWIWFEHLLSEIQQNDEVVFDFTHGFRSVPIIFSTAISFVQKVKPFTLLNAYYGYMKPDRTGEIIDMGSFYKINEWADGVSQIIETADTSKLAQVAEKDTSKSFKSLNDSELIDALKELSGIVKNIDVNRIAITANNALAIIKSKIEECKNSDSKAAILLLKMIQDKFIDLSIQEPISGAYDKNYFEMQLKLIELLNEHKLFMQSFSVMSEFIASIGMIGAKDKHKKNIFNDDGRKGRKYAGVFLNMIQFLEKDWDFKNDDADRMKVLSPCYIQLEKLEIIDKLRSNINALKDLRNGFAHAWTSFGPDKLQELANVEQHAQNCLQVLKESIEILIDNNLLN